MFVSMFVCDPRVYVVISMISMMIVVTIKCKVTVSVCECV